MDLTKSTAAKNKESLVWLDWVEKRTKYITDSDIECSFEQDAAAVMNLGTELQQLLYDRTQGRVSEDVHATGVGNGLEAHRVFKNRYEPRTAGTKRALLKQILSVKSASRVDEVERKFLFQRTWKSPS